MRGNRAVILWAFTWVFLVSFSGALAQDPWVISTPVTVTEPMAVGDVIVVAGGQLEVRDVPEPGLRLSGNLQVVETGSVLLSNSVIQVMSRYNGQYHVVVVGQGHLSVEGCDYRIPYGVQHGLVAAESGRIDVSDTDFSFAQLMAMGNSTLSARRLNGQFECIVQDAGTLTLEDIPRDGGMGSLWVWPTFMPASKAVYSPPMPGFVESYVFPPPGATGIDQDFSITRCEVKLWPLLVREGVDLTIRDVSPDNWMVVGFHLPTDFTIQGLQNNRYYQDWTMPFADRTVRVVNSSIDTWNLYPEDEAEVTVENSLIGELLTMGSASAVMRNTTVDGTGGFFGSGDRSTVDAEGCTFTCSVQATGESTMVLRNSLVLPYPEDPQGLWTRFGAYDQATLFLAQTPAASTPDLTGSGAIVVTNIANLPPHPPPKQSPVALMGVAGVFSLDPARALKKWVLKVRRPGAPRAKVLGKGRENADGQVLGTWGVKKPRKDRELILKVKDREGNIYKSTTLVPGAP